MTEKGRGECDGISWGLTTERNVCGTTAFPQGATSLSEKQRNATSTGGAKLCSLGQISLLREYWLWL